MTQQELAEKMTHYTNLTQGQAYDAVRALISLVVDQVKQGGCVGVVGFGMFEPGKKPGGETYLMFRQHKSLNTELNPQKPSFKTPVNRAATR